MLRFGEFAAKHRLSVWLCFLTALPAVTMMSPSFSSLIAMAFLIAGLFLVRFVAHEEGFWKA